MRSNLRYGKIETPISVVAAAARRQQLIYESKRIEGQLDDPVRAGRFPAMADYTAWKARAGRALKLFKEEAKQLQEWIEKQSVVDSADLLFFESYKLLRTLEKEVDFDEDEAAFMRRLDLYFSKQEKQECLNGKVEGL